MIPDYTIDSLPDDFEIMILIGGTYWSMVRFQIPELNKVINHCIEQGIAVAAICDGATFLAANGTSTLEFSRDILKLLDVKLPIDVMEWYSCYKKGTFGDI